MTDQERADSIAEYIKGERVVPMLTWEIHCLLQERAELLQRIRQLERRACRLVLAGWGAEL